MENEKPLTKTETKVSNNKMPNTIIVSNQENEPEKIVCEVCGHANSKYVAICKMCSNYLIN